MEPMWCELCSVQYHLPLFVLPSQFFLKFPCLVHWRNILGTLFQAEIYSNCQFCAYWEANTPTHGCKFCMVFTFLFLGILIQIQHPREQSHFHFLLSFNWGINRIHAPWHKGRG
jgi:hypothetical protein